MSSRYWISSYSPVDWKCKSQDLSSFSLLLAPAGCLYWTRFLLNHGRELLHFKKFPRCDPIRERAHMQRKVEELSVTKVCKHSSAAMQQSSGRYRPKSVYK